MTFRLQGKDMNGLDMAQFLESVKHYHILENLDDHEICGFLERLLEWQNCELAKRTNMENREINDLKENRIGNQSIREKGNELIKQSHESEETMKDQLIQFIQVDFAQTLQAR